MGERERHTKKLPDRQATSANLQNQIDVRDGLPPAGSAASLRQFGGETYRDKLASGSEAVDALFKETDVIMRKYKDVLGEKAEYYANECVLDGCASNIVTRDSNLALHKDPNNTTISCLTGCNPNTDHAPWKGGEFLVGYGCYAFDLEPGTDPASHELSPPRNKTGTRPQAARFWGTTPRTSTASSPSGRRTARARSACATH